MISIEGQLWRTNYAGEKIEDISGAFLEASVNMDTANDMTWSLSASLTYDGWKSLQPYKDWVVPYLIATYPDGKVYQGPLGLFLVLDSPEEHRETHGRVRLTAMDPLWLLARQGFTGKVQAVKGIAHHRVVRQILDGAVLTDDPQGRRRFIIPETPKTFRKDHEWPRTTTRLDLCNEVCEGMGCYPLWTTKTGLITTKRAGEARLKQRHPVRVFSANVPENFLKTYELPWGGFEGNVTGTVNTSPRGDDFINEILMINDDPDLPKIHVKGRTTNPKNVRSAMESKGRRHTRRKHNRVVPDDATAREVAEALLDELSTKNSTIRVSVHPDPETEFARETVRLHVRNTNNDWVANDKYAVHRVEYLLFPNDGMMTLDLGRIDEANDVTFR